MRYVFFVSDRTGVTTEALGNALLTQFPNVEFTKKVVPFVDSTAKAKQIANDIKQHYIEDSVKPIVLTSIIDPELRKYFDLPYVHYIDFFASFIPQLEQELSQKASLSVGMSHGITNEDKYSNRIHAIDFAIYHDDGGSLKSYDVADIILVGVSRVGKTPTCLYLAVNYGIKAANYPLVEHEICSSVPSILRPYRKKLFGLTIEPEILCRIRFERLPDSIYADLSTCAREISIIEDMMKINNIPYVDTSHKSIEEISAFIMQKVRLSRQF